MGQTMVEPITPLHVASTLSCQDPLAMLAWLEEAFGFEPSMLILDAQGGLVHAEVQFGSSRVIVGGELGEIARSPRSIGGINTQKLHLQLASGIGAHFERARAAGALILREPALQPYGDCVYVCSDPEGHVWSISQTMPADAASSQTAK